MPKALQARLAEEIAKENSNYQKIGEPAPQRLRDALSELPPFNYYLLFAITCHLSLLLSHKDKNKMDLNNLSICIGPCLELERWLFNYLVGDWRRCWQGCFTEKRFLEAEKAFEAGGEYEVPDLEGKKDDGDTGEEVKTPVTAVTADEKSTEAVSGNGGGSGKASRSGSTQEVEKDKPLPTPKSSPPLPPPNENIKPENSLSSLPDYSGYINGSVPATPDKIEKLDRKALFGSLDTKRPSTAQGTEGSPKIGTPGETGLAAAAKKKPSHSRTQSELSPVVPQGEQQQLSPIQSTSPIEMPFKLRGGSES